MLAQSEDDDSVSDDERIIASQSEHDMYKCIKDKYGQLPKDTFKKQLLLYSVNDLTIYRNGLYMISNSNVPDTPDGQLVVRKDTSNSNGCTDAEKLCEDIYNLYQYIEGDSSVDIIRMFTDRSRKAYLTSASKLLTKQVSIGNEVKLSMDDFLPSLLSEMRNDRDILIKEISEFKKSIGILQRIQEDIRYISLDLSDTRDRVSKLEVYIDDKLISDDHNLDMDSMNKKWKQANKSVKKLVKRTVVIEQQISSIHTSGTELKNRISGNHAVLTERMNNLELSRGFARPVQTSPTHSSMSPNTPNQQRVVSPITPGFDNTHTGSTRIVLPAFPLQSEVNDAERASRLRSRVHSAFIAGHQNVPFIEVAHPDSHRQTTLPQPVVSSGTRATNDPDQTYCKQRYRDNRDTQGPKQATNVTCSGMCSFRQKMHTDMYIQNQPAPVPSRLEFTNQPEQINCKERSYHGSDVGDITDGTNMTYQPQKQNKSAIENTSRHEDVRNTEHSPVLDTQRKSRPKSDGITNVTRKITPTHRMDSDSLTVTIRPGVSDTRREAQYQPTSLSALQGYVRVERHKPSSFFVGGILIKNDSVDDTIEAVRAHLTNATCSVKSIRKLRLSDITMSVRVVVNHSDQDKLTDDKFWPEGISCRQWVN
jgi:hypothetical protein